MDCMEKVGTKKKMMRKTKTQIQSPFCVTERERERERELQYCDSIN